MISRLVDMVRRRKRFAIGAAVLLVALGVTWGVQQYALRALHGDVEARRVDLAENAFQETHASFQTLLSDVQGRASNLSTDADVTAGLHRAIDSTRSVAAGERRERDLVEYVTALRLPEHTTVEVYGVQGRLLAWNGARVPTTLDPAGIADAPRRTVVARDGDIRTALASWRLVRRGETVIGAVRVVRVVQYRPPVQNRFIRGFSLEAEWSRQTGKRLMVTWGDPDERSGETVDQTTDERAGLNEQAGPNERASARPSRTLATADGHPIATVSVDVMSGEQLLRRTASTYNDILALWVTLLMAWGTAGAWVEYRTVTARLRDAAPTQRFTASALAFLSVAGLWWAVRYALLALDVPARWQGSDGILAPLFDPSYLASTLGVGLMRSTGDLLLTALFAVVFAVGLMHLGAQFRLRVDAISDVPERIRSTPPGHPSGVLFITTLFALMGLLVGGTFLLSAFVRRAVLDSTLDYFSRTGLLPEPLVLVVLCALFMLVVAVVIGGVGLLWVGGRLLVRFQPERWPRGMVTLGMTLASLTVLALLYLGLDTSDHVPLGVMMIYLGMIGTTAAFGLTWPHAGVGQLTLRGLLPSILALTVLLYPLLYTGMDTQRREHMVEAAASFEAGRDPRVLFSIGQILEAARDDLEPVLASESVALPEDVDDVTARLVRRSLLASLTTYEASLTLFRADGTPLYRTTAAGPQTRRTTPALADRNAFDVLRRTYRLRGRTGPVVEQLRADELTERRTDASFQYAGLTPLTLGDEAVRDEAVRAGGRAPEPDYWVLMRAEPRSLLPGTGTGVPRVLLPDGSFSDLYAELSLAEFRRNILVRSLGRDFGRAQLPAQLRSRLTQPGAELWTRETIRGRQYLTYYHTRTPEARRGRDGPPSVVAVRIASVLAFDHLYYLLRLTVAGMCVGLVLYLIGLYGRVQRGLLPAKEVRFRDKVLNAFLIVGVVSMVAVGVVGVQVVTSENDRVTERRLHDDLSRVEETLALQARSGERIWQAAQRIDVDSLAARVGLDVHVYRDGSLVGTSRPRLVRDRLVDERLPGRVYRALYDDAFRFTTAPSSIGRFRYMVGYQALPDAQGQPRIVIGVPTLGQQERIVEEQARTLAYLFGALLMLVVVVMLTALILANALAQPIAQLREGLEAVGEGRFARELNVDTRDEIGDLVQTFNDMRDQLAESRRKLAQQERELAWREMARQVAHEIKNPLTPMKLSIQHMRRAMKRERQEESSTVSDRFTELFDRITETLIEQINALVRIANEFSTFARLPTRVEEKLDLNEVIREAARLMREESDAVTIELDLHDAPLVVEADREELRRLYINLIKNAIQAIPSHREGRIELATKVHALEGDASPAAQSTITDNGTGIPDDLQDKIFQPNFSTKTSGTGLGLAIARKSIEELDGAIGFETTEGEGTTFWIRLPLAEETTVEA